MAAINTTQQLAKVRAKIDAQQQIISSLENELQKTILGQTPATGYVDNILSAYGGVVDGAMLEAAFKEGLDNFSDADDQTALRHMLYQARALLGELRVEEQQWNTEVNEEKARRKELTDFAKG